MIRRIFFSLLALVALCAYGSEIHLADPTIFFDGETFYLTGTGDSNGFLMYSSTDLIHWTAVGNATGKRALYKDDSYGSSNFWAPQIFLYDGSYYMAYCADEQIAIAKSDSPMGPFKQDTPTCLNGTTGQIDPFVFFDDDGTKYIYYVRFINGNSIYVGELEDDFMSIKESTITHCVSAESGTWERSTNTPTAQVVEGPTVIKDNGYYFLLYSANHYQNIDYSVGYAYSTSPTGPWTKVGHPFLMRQNTGLNGTGHGDLFQDAEGNWYYVFHAHESNLSVGSRRTVIIPITLTDDPANKFIPQIDRMVILDDAASSNTTFPTASQTFEVDGVQYIVSNEAAKRVDVSCKDVVNFGGYEGELTIPESVAYGEEEYSVVSIGVGAFYNTPNLKKVELPSSLLKIDVSAFESSGIRQIEIPSSVTSIGYRSFDEATSLLDVLMDKASAPNIGSNTFSSTTQSDGKLWVPEGAESSYQGKSVWSDFTRISGVEGGNKLYDFSYDGLYYSIESESEGTCKVCAQTSQYASYKTSPLIVPPYAVYQEKDYAVVGLSRMALRDCRLIETLSLSEGIEDIGTYAFYGMYALKEITLPSTTTAVENYAFRDCESLETITCLAATPPTVSASATFPDNAYEGTLYVPYGAKDAYTSADVWANFYNIVELEPSAIELLPAEYASSAHTLYNLQGMRVSDAYRGIVVLNGKKYLKE